MENLTNADCDPTGNLNPVEFHVWRCWAHCETQKELEAITGLPFGTAKAIIGDVYSILRVSDKGAAIHKSWKMEIFTKENCELPKKKS
jgi:hypothetical protein